MDEPVDAWILRGPYAPPFDADNKWLALELSCNLAQRDFMVVFTLDSSTYLNYKCGIVNSTPFQHFSFFLSF